MLKNYKKSGLNTISITYNGEKIRFNLFRELRITDANIDREIKYQPSHYGFLALLHKKLLTRFEELKTEKNRLWGHLYLSAKEKVHAGRPYNDEMCKAYADSHKKYIAAHKACIQAKDDADTIFAIVKAFEQRKDLIQTLSSNNRKFNN